ncbi:unnamed protein product [Hydatigera taeniaeformis]|uniref:Uncharacterized protein n=1 Tax=Hydatigena taeniaeformis TaxID=6205 RepID=A0A0R3XBY8_HYDTA|nr:unnamed protein product [Hydatigera taeniaeformis]
MKECGLLNGAVAGSECMQATRGREAALPRVVREELVVREMTSEVAQHGSGRGSQASRMNDGGEGCEVEATAAAAAPPPPPPLPPLLQRTHFLTPPSHSILLLSATVHPPTHSLHSISPPHPATSHNASLYHIDGMSRTGAIVECPA